MSLTQVKQLAGRLSLKDLRALGDWIHDRLDSVEDPAPAKRAGRREVVPGTSRQSGEWTYRLEYVRCGTKTCKCSRGQGHGPYWYGYQAGGRRGKTVSKYFGKQLPGAEPAAADRKSDGRSAGGRKRV
ncbi:MAG TPA: DUF6788 family protein [Pyrinomonadaceae bacterium]|jgi:hypothetical protein